MAKRKGKSVSFDAMVKFFMQNYDIPTKKDIAKLNVKIDRLEKMLKQKATFTGGRRGKAGRGKFSMTASDVVLDAVKGSGKRGMDFSDIQSKTGFEDKKLRNIIFRLNKLGRIKRKNRGIYISG